MNILILDSWLREYLKTQATVQEIAKYLSLCGPSVERLIKIRGDYIYDIEVTTNRVDLMSVVGIAQEVSAILPQFGIKSVFTSPLLNLKPPQKSAKFKITITDPLHTNKRIMGVVLDNVNIQPSDETIRKRLNSAGIRSINNVVDITNYLMMSLGQPTHVFDYDRIKSGKLLFRYSRKGEKVTSLENKTYTLTGDEIVIDDTTGRIIDLPGIIGTANSVVTQMSKRILFFIDSPDPVKLRKTSMTLGIRTMAATINEKAVSAQMAQYALYLGIRLFKKHAGSTVVSEIYDHFPNPIRETKISLPLWQIEKIIGVLISEAKLINILNSLNLKCSIRANQLTVTVPHQRQNDITIAQDVIEEIARIYGYNNLPSILPRGALPEKLHSVNLNFKTELKIKELLRAWGFSETYSYSMVSKKELDLTGQSANSLLRISNPLSQDWLYLRRELLPSMFTHVIHNQYLFPEMKLFEISTAFIPQGEKLPREKMMLVAIITGKDAFSQIKGTAEAVLEKLNITNCTHTYQKTASNIWSKDNCATVKTNGETVMTYGQISTSILIRLNIKIAIYALEADVEALFKHIKPYSAFKPISRFSPLREDFSFTFAKPIKLGFIIETICKIDPLISSVSLIDRFENNATFRLVFDDSKKQLSTAGLLPVRNKIIKTISEKFFAKLIGKV